MLPDKMAISHSNHLFIPVAFVFCLLSQLVHVADFYDYTESRQFEKNLAVSKRRNNTQGLPNYNWKPPNKYHGPSGKESTAEKTGTEFTKPEDPEQRVADPWIKKMQEISRQKGEKWAPYKRNENGKLTLDNVEETTKASELTNDESITLPMFSKSVESNENIEEGSRISGNSVEENVESPEIDAIIDAVIPETSAQRPTADRDSAGMKNLQNSSELNSSHGSNADGPSNRKFRNDRWGMSVKNPPAEFLRETYVTAAHQRRENSEASETRKDLEKQEASANHERNELEEDRMLGSIVDSYSEESVSGQLKNLDIRETASHTRRNFDGFPKDSENSERRSHRFKELAARDGQSSVSRGDDEEESSEVSMGDDEEIVTANPLTRKGKEAKYDTRGKDEGEPLNHGGSFHPGRWGMSVSSPPTEFLKDISRRSMHRKSEESIGSEKDGKDRETGRRGVSVSSPPREFLEDIPMHRGHGAGHSAVKTRSRPGEVKGSSGDRSPAPQRRRNLRADLAGQITDGSSEEFARPSLGKVPGVLHNFGDRGFDTWSNHPASVDLNEKLSPKHLKFLIRASQTSVDFGPSVMDLPIFCRVRIPFPPFRI